MSGDDRIKIITLGEFGVGKTNLIRAAAGQEFEPKRPAKFDGQCFESQIQYEDKLYKYYILDSGSQEEKHNFDTRFFKDVKIIFIVCSINNRESFKMIDFYLHKGYTLEWIELRIKAIINRKKLTKVWNDGGIKESKEYAILTNEIYKTWSGMTASEYKKFKNIRKENLRDNMTDVEVALADLGELATREIAKKKNPKGLKENIDIARCGGEIASNTKKNLETALGDTVITNKNLLNYKYINELED